jgi:hypothetical protein
MRCDLSEVGINIKQSCNVMDNKKKYVHDIFSKFHVFSSHFHLMLGANFMYIVFWNN